MTSVSAGVAASARPHPQASFFDAQRNDVRNHALGYVSDKLHLRRVELNIAGTEAPFDHQVRHVKTKLRRNFRGQAFDFQLRE